MSSETQDGPVALDGAGAASDPSDPEAIRHEIAETTSEIGRTVEALAAKTDVKEQARQKVREQIAQRPAIGFAAAALLLLWLVRRRR